MAKRGAHAPSFLQTAPEGINSFEELYGAQNLSSASEWLSTSPSEALTGVRIITAAPEVEGVMDAVSELDKRGIVFSIGHRLVRRFNDSN